MTVKQAIEFLLDRLSTRGQSLESAFGAFGGTIGNVEIVQRDTNAAIELWQQKHDASGLKRVAATLRALGNLTDAEYERVMQALDAARKQAQRNDP